jgi:hypothetical protein
MTRNGERCYSIVVPRSLNSFACTGAADKPDARRAPAARQQQVAVLANLAKPDEPRHDPAGHVAIAAGTVRK